MNVPDSGPAATQAATVIGPFFIIPLSIWSLLIAPDCA